MGWDTAVHFCLTLSRLNIFSFLLQAVYMFYALAIVCDDFFVPSLEKICEVSVRAGALLRQQCPELGTQ